MSMPVVTRRFMNSDTGTRPAETCQEILFALFHPNTMSPSFYMQYPVDKQVEDKCPSVHIVCRGLFFCLAQANEYLPTLSTKRVGKNIGCVDLAAELLV